MALQFPMRRREDDSLRKRRKGLYVLPSLFTSLNIAAGYYAIAQVLQGSATEPDHFNNAAKAIGLAILADGLDGRIARITNTTSDFGRELDSLADVIAFGVAPAVLAWTWGFRQLPPVWAPDLRSRLIHLGAIVTFVFMVAGAARLARFNIQTNPQPSNPGRPGHKYFVGMPIPAGAGVIAATVHLFDGRPLMNWWESVVWLLFVAAAAFLMVSTWRFYSFKDLNFRSAHSYRLFIVIGLVIALGWLFSEYVLFGLALTYMLYGVVVRLSSVFRRHTNPPAPPLQSVPELK
jgi:CDP-diacylglycerol--serine O-phosphatidyltransferase